MRFDLRWEGRHYPSDRGFYRLRTRRVLGRRMGFRYWPSLRSRVKPDITTRGTKVLKPK